MTGLALQRAVPAGVRIAFGTDAGVSLHGRNADEFPLMVQHGMTPMAAIQAATVNAADLLGLASEVGTIEPGRVRRQSRRGTRRSARRCWRCFGQMNFVMSRGRYPRQEGLSADGPWGEIGK